MSWLAKIRLARDSVDDLIELCDAILEDYGAGCINYEQYCDYIDIACYYLDLLALESSKRNLAKRGYFV